MTVKEYLGNIRKKDIELIALEDAILETETILTRISPVLSDLPHATGNVDKMSNGISKLIELKDLLNLKIYAICELKEIIFDEIEGLENPLHRTVLIERYINYKSFEEISIKMNYSYHHVCHLHGHSLQEYEKLIGDRLR